MKEEDALQFSICEFLRWAATPETLWHSIPNGLPSRPRSVHRFKKLGLRPGAGDLLVIVGGRAHYLEVKVPGPRGVQSLDQLGFQAHCAVAGVPYVVCRSLDEAKSVLQQWGALRSNVRLMAA